MKNEKVLLFAAGLAVGAGIACFTKSQAGKKLAVSVVGKGMELKDCVASMAERVKETVDDVVAEAKYANEQKVKTN
ncbi:MAG: YtxH domain-containing protein [Synergistaceae bacterium]|jgi:hypothetical protein|nr:YtxH domain-containing protein [Synergistaceae bacterium]